MCDDFTDDAIFQKHIAPGVGSVHPALMPHFSHKIEFQSSR